jgi:two-component sensor histidine kinase
MAKGLVADPGRVVVEVEAEEEAMWGPDLVVPLGLIAGEALTNAIKHAFPEGCGGRVRLVLRAVGDGLMRLCVEDDGAGLPAERREGSLGLRLIEMFARQIKGRAAMENRIGGGGRW